ncbi:MAG: Gfo/Idh/MocA family protein [Candidatus Poribacteria bacterium]
MSSKVLGFGVVGLGMGMSRSGTIAQTEGAKLVAVADLIEERRNNAAERFGCDTYEDYREMFDRDDIDVGMAMTPSGLHAEIGMEAAKRGKHVITTKPMDVSLEKCDALIKCCEDNGVKLLVDFGERYGGMNKKIRRAMELSVLGKVYLAELRMKWYRADSYYEGWHGTWALDGGGSVMNQGVHFVDLLQWFMGPVDSVIGHYGVYGHKNCETEDMTAAIVKFKSGALGTILTTTTYNRKQQLSMIEIHGEKGVIGRGPDVWEFVGEEPVVEVPPGPGNVIEDAIRVINEGAAPAVDGYEGRKSVELNLAIYESAKRGTEVKLPL